MGVHKTTASSLCAILLVLLALPLAALTPPWDAKELTNAADLVAEGTIGAPVQCLGRVEKLPHAERFKFMVPFTVRKIVRERVKGRVKAGETFPLYFHHTVYKPGATGDQDRSHFPGEEGTYYLQRLEDGTWHQVHWSGAVLTKEGNGALPKCPPFRRSAK
ncbi:MAG: hypothetical protein HYV03_08295 [Deltaproteobacteria bacterium]|nr:hypothetical protein [Deltaproteobacteria bacterium]